MSSRNGHYRTVERAGKLDSERLPEIKMKDKATNFAEKFQQEQDTKSKQNRNKFYIDEQISDSSDSATEDPEFLKFHDFELMPKMRETMQPGSRPNLEALYVSSP